MVGASTFVASFLDVGSVSDCFCLSSLDASLKADNASAVSEVGVVDDKGTLAGGGLALLVLFLKVEAADFGLAVVVCVLSPVVEASAVLVVPSASERLCILYTL